MFMEKDKNILHCNVYSLFPRIYFAPMSLMIENSYKLLTLMLPLKQLGHLARIEALGIHSLPGAQRNARD